MNKTKRFAVVLAFIALATCAATAALADSINLSESWYIKITNISLGDDDFTEYQTYGWSSTSLIEPKLLDPDPLDPGLFRTLVFDFHTGQADMDAEAWFMPFATVGSTWTATMSFDWEIHCDNPQVLFGVYTDDGGLTKSAWWTAPTGSSYRSGSASFGTGTLAGIPPAFYVSFAAVPEPTSFVALLIPISLSGIGFAWRRARK